MDGLLLMAAGDQHGDLVSEMHAGMSVVFVDRPPGDIVADTVLMGRVTVLRALAHLTPRPVIGFELADLLNVTVNAQDVSRLGVDAAELLFGRVHGNASAARKVVSPVHLAPRCSGEVAP